MAMRPVLQQPGGQFHVVLESATPFLESGSSSCSGKSSCVCNPSAGRESAARKENNSENNSAFIVYSSARDLQRSVRANQPLLRISAVVRGTCG